MQKVGLKSTKLVITRLSILAANQHQRRIQQQDLLQQNMAVNKNKANNPFLPRFPHLSSHIITTSSILARSNLDLLHHLASKDKPMHLPLLKTDERSFWERWLGGKPKQEAAQSNGENGDDDWWGLRRPGMKHDHHKSEEGYANDDRIESSESDSDFDDEDDDDDHGGEMMPVPGC